MNTGGELILHWYEQDSYSDVLAVMEDADTLPQRYEWWRRGIAERLETLNRAGHVATLVTIDPRCFLAWCVLRDLSPDAEARIAYARLNAFRQRMNSLADLEETSASFPDPIDVWSLTAARSPMPPAF